MRKTPGQSLPVWLPRRRPYLALEVGAFVLHAAGGELDLSVIVFLDDGEALTVGSERTETRC